MSAFLDGRPKPVRSLSRFLVFALIVVIGVSGLTARLFYLQIVDGGRLATLSTHNRTVLEAIPAPRGLIYDRNGRPLVTNVPTFVGQAAPVGPAGRPAPECRRSPGGPARDAGRRHQRDHRQQPGIDLRPRPDRRATSTSRRPASSRRPATTCPGVEVVVEARRQYTDGPLMSQILGYTGPVSGEQLADAQGARLPARRPHRQGRASRRRTRRELRGVVRHARASSATPRAVGRRSCRRSPTPQPGDSLTLTIDTKDQQEAQKALHVGDEGGRDQARRRHRDEPADRRDPRDGQPADLRQQPVRPRDQQRRLREAAQEPGQAADSTTRSRRTTRPGRPTSSSPARASLADKKITADDEGRDARATSRSGRPGSTTGTTAASGPATSTAGSATRATRSSSRWPASSGSTASATGRSSTASARRPASTCPARCPGIVPSNQWKQDTLGAPDLPGRDLPGRHRPGLRRRDADPAHQRLCRARQRRDALPAADRPATIVGPDGDRRAAVRAEGPPQDGGASRACSRRCATPPATPSLVRHTYNLVDLPIKIAGKSGTAEFGTRDSKGRLPFHSWFVGFVPKDPRTDRSTRPTRSWSCSPSPTTRGRRATSATEIVKYFFQLHFGIKKDYRLPNLLKRGNFYQSN